MQNIIENTQYDILLNLAFYVTRRVDFTCITFSSLTTNIFPTDGNEELRITYIKLDFDCPPFSRLWELQSSGF